MGIDITNVQAKIDKTKKEIDLAIANNKDYRKIYENSKATNLFK